jgi:hypothetical protein
LSALACSRCVVFVAILTGASGCDLLSLLYGDSDSQPPVENPVATNGAAADWKIDVGTGETSFEPLSDGEVVSKTQGPQGGYHVWVSLHLLGAIPTTLDAQIEVASGGMVISRAAAYVEPKDDPPPPGRKVIVAQRAFVDATTTGEIVIDVKVVDPDTKAWASAQRRVVLR